MIVVCATTTARCLERMSRPIAIASATDPPLELIKIGGRALPSDATKRAKIAAVPISIFPSAEIHLGQCGSQAEFSAWTRTKDMDGCGAGLDGTRSVSEGVGAAAQAIVVANTSVSE